MSTTNNTVRKSDPDTVIYHWSRPKSRAKKILLIAGGISLLGIVAATVYFYSIPRESKPATEPARVVDDGWDEPYAVSKQELAAREVSRLKDSPPAVGSDKNAVTEYYAQLLFNQKVAEQYKDVIVTYNNYTNSLNGQKPDINIYLATSDAYKSFGDKKKAMQLLDKAEPLAKQTITSPNDLAVALDIIRSSKEDLK